MFPLLSALLQEKAATLQAPAPSFYNSFNVKFDVEEEEESLFRTEETDADGLVIMVSEKGEEVDRYPLDIAEKFALYPYPVRFADDSEYPFYSEGFPDERGLVRVFNRQGVELGWYRKNFADTLPTLPSHLKEF